MSAIHQQEYNSDELGILSFPHQEVDNDNNPSGKSKGKWEYTAKPRPGPGHNRALENVTQDLAARRFADLYDGRLLYCHSQGAWFEWNGAIWRKNEKSCLLILRDNSRAISLLDSQERKRGLFSIRALHGVLRSSPRRTPFFPGSLPIRTRILGSLGLRTARSIYSRAALVWRCKAIRLPSPLLLRRLIAAIARCGSNF
jgi:hypothetical protein